MGGARVDRSLNLAANQLRGPIVTGLGRLTALTCVHIVHTHTLPITHTLPHTPAFPAVPRPKHMYLGCVPVPPRTPPT